MKQTFDTETLPSRSTEILNEYVKGGLVEFIDDRKDKYNLTIRGLLFIMFFTSPDRAPAAFGQFLNLLGEFEKWQEGRLVNKGTLQ